jgi:starvation-inducible DNA-binding protein
MTVHAKSPAVGAIARRNSPLATPTDLVEAVSRDTAGALNALLADVFAVYVKTKSFHWHMTGPHFLSYHTLLDSQAAELIGMTDPIAERVRKLGSPTLHSIGQIARLQRCLDNDADYVEPADMLAELREDNLALVARFREVHALCASEDDIATAGLIEGWVDETEGRIWFLFEAGRPLDSTGR